jgi:quercetin dioxygenase-like cupin family protein
MDLRQNQFIIPETVQSELMNFRPAISFFTIIILSLSLFFLSLNSNAVLAQDLVNREVLKQGDLTSNGDMQVIMASLELKPGAVIPRHTHNGDEYLYIISGGKVETPDKKEIEFKTGGSFHFPRDVPHAGFKVIGTETLKALTIHIVDKGKPLSVPVK